MTPTKPPVRGRPWVAGQSGNPAGRKPGTRSKYVEMREAALADWLKVRPAVVEKALSGDMAAARLLAERGQSPLRPESAPMVVDIPAGTFGERAAALVQRALDGEISATSAAELLDAMTKAAVAEELDRKE